VAYEGYLELGGTEIINAARTEAYVGSLMPSFGLKGCQDCTGLAEALGAVNVLGDEQRQGLIGPVNHNLANAPRPMPDDLFPEWEWIVTPGAVVTDEIVDDPSSVQNLPGVLRVSGTPSAPLQSWGYVKYTEHSLMGWVQDVATGGAATLMWLSMAVKGPASGVSVIAQFYDTDDNLILTTPARTFTGPFPTWTRVGVHASSTALRDANTAVLTVQALANSSDPGVLEFSNMLIQANTAPGGTQHWQEYVDHGMADSLQFEYLGVGLDFLSQRTLLREWDVARQVIEQREYQSPLQDNAPWVDPSDPDSLNFWGIYPLSWSGVDDGTRETPVTELIGDGAVSGRSRAASRDMRFEGVLLGKDERALASGLAWLNRALDSTRCEGAGQPCRGESMRFFSACPPACGYDPCMDTPLSFDFADGEGQDTEDIGNWTPSPAGMVGYDATGSTPCNLAGLRFTGYVDGREYTFSRKVGGFVPGEWYTARFNIVSGAGVTSAAIAEGPSVSLPASAFWNVCDTRSMFTMSWRATSDVQTLQVKFYVDDVDPTLQDPQGSTYVSLTALDVQRVAAPTVVYSTTFPDNGSLLNGWNLRPSTSDVSSSVQRLWGGAGAAIRFTAQTAGQDVGSGILVGRSIRNMELGQRYRATISLSLGSSGLPDPDLAWSAPNLAIEPVVWDHSSGVGTATTVIEFTAEYSTQDFGLALMSDYNLPSAYDSLYIEMQFVSLERIPSEGERLPHPNPGRRYERNMYRVTAIQGPRVEETYSKECGAMMRVTFGLNAGVPFVYGLTQEVGSAFGGSSSLVPALSCVDGGQVRTNLIPNPSVEVDLTGWGSSGAGTLTRTAGGFCGSWRATRSVPSGNKGTVAIATPASGIPITGGYPYTFSIALLRSTAFPEGTDTPGALEIEWDTGEVVSQPFGRLAASVPPSGVPRYSVTGFAPEGATQATVRVRYAPDISSPWGFIADCAMFELGTTPLPYFDGSFPDAEWTGPANGSPSILTPVEEDFLQDPSCPPLPEPPAPPTIPEDCFEVVGSWQRYAISVPSIMVPVNSSALPIVRISTGDVAARQLRMRWYPNPDGDSVGSLVECSYEAEITVSYMPPFSEMVVDTITKEATASRVGLTDRNANHLLYGPDNGPVEWPELRCGIPYIFTLDVSTDDDVGELDVFLDLGLRV
jgi:hypothetical protein